MRRVVRAVVLSSIGAPALAGCGTARPPAAGSAADGLALVVDGAPSEVIARLKLEAMLQGGDVVAETADTFSVDFGVWTQEIHATSGPARGAVRETEVHERATYGVRPAAGGGSLVSITHTPTWWHPDMRCWLAGPFDAAPADASTNGLADGPAAGPRPRIAGAR